MISIFYYLARKCAWLVLGLTLVFAACNNLARAQTNSAEVLAKAPTFSILVDVSGGSNPALTPEFMREAVKAIEPRLREQPMATTVKIWTVGHSALATETFSARILAKISAEGVPINMIVAKVREILLDFPAHAEKKGIHQQSHLIGGLFDASKTINHKAARNTVFYLTDGVENSPLGNCYRDQNCKLSLPKGAKIDLSNVEVVMLGVGSGLPSNQQIAVTAAWEGFLKAADAHPISVRKLF